MPQAVPVTITLTLNIQPEAWLDRDIETPDDALRLIAEVQQHAESVLRDLYTDQGWID